MTMQSLTETAAGSAALTCLCNAVVQQSCNLVSATCSTTSAAIADALRTIASARHIDWTGRAAALFQDRMSEVQTQVTALDDDVHATRLLAWRGDAS